MSPVGILNGSEVFPTVGKTSLPRPLCRRRTPLPEAARAARESWRVVWREARRCSREGVSLAGGDERAAILAAVELVRSRPQGDALAVRARVAASTDHGMIFRLGWLDGERVLAAADDHGRCP